MLQFSQASGVSCPTSLLCQCSLKFWMNGNGLWIKVAKYAWRFLDVSKAFDSVSHLSLLKKLSEIGLHYLIRWIRSYLAAGVSL